MNHKPDHMNYKSAHIIYKSITQSISPLMKYTLQSAIFCDTARRIADDITDAQRPTTPNIPRSSVLCSLAF